MKLRPFTLLVSAVFLFAACASAPAPTTAPTSVSATATLASDAIQLTPVPAPREIAFAKSYLQVHYCTDRTTPLTMTILTPKNLAAPAPVLIHAKFQFEFIRPFVENGFLVANIDWREPPAFKLPIGVHDVKCAIRYLRAHAEQYNLDPDHIGIFGCSRGGHMAALVGVTDASAGMEGNYGFENESSRVQAVAMYDGIANMKTNYADAPEELNEVHGITSFADPQVARLSPITYASKDDPPFLILASDAEGWRGQAEEMKDALEAVQVPVTYIPLEGATHCNFPVGGEYTQEKVVERLVEFFKRTLQAQ